MSLDVSQLNILAVDLGATGARTTAAAARVVAKTAADIERDAKAFAPVDTGNLRNSISSSLRGLQAEIGPTASYAAFVEYGTSRTGPAAFMGPALDRNSGAFVDALAALVNGGLPR